MKTLIDNVRKEINSQVSLLMHVTLNTLLCTSYFWSEGDRGYINS